MHRALAQTLILIAIAAANTLHAADAPALPGFTLSQPRTYRLKVAVRVTAPGNLLRNVVVTGPVPIDWPEQQVELISETKPPGVRTRVNEIEGQAAMMTASIPAIPGGQTTVIQREYNITRYRITLNVAPESLRVAPNLPRGWKLYLMSAPGVETSDRRIAALAEKFEQPEADAWSNTRSSFDWIRENIDYKLGNFRGALQTVRDSSGDCEDMTALFVALCRARGIPARTVWIEGHAYGEFYLEDESGQGHWIPAQLAGPPWFGEMTEYRPILQKGDRFYDALQRRHVRYVPQTARAVGGQVKLEISYHILDQNP